MSQETIIKLLKKHYKKCKEEWVTAKYLERRLGLANASVTKSLRKMRESREVEYRIIKNHVNINLFQYKHKIT